MDRALRAERRAGRDVMTATPPDGAVVTDGAGAYLRWRERWVRWSFDDYTPEEPHGECRMLAPPSVVRMLAAGLHCTVQLSAH